MHYIEINKDFINSHQQINQIFPEDWKDMSITGKAEDWGGKKKHAIRELFQADHIMIDSKQSMTFYRQGESSSFFRIQTGHNYTVYEHFSLLCNIIHTGFAGIQYTADGILISKKATKQYIEESPEAQKKKADILHERQFLIRPRHHAL